MKRNSHKTSKRFWMSAAIGFALLLLVATPRTATAQWTTGTDISNTNSGNVGVGTSTSASRLDVLVNAEWVARFKKTNATNGGIIIDAAAGYNPNLALAVNGTAKWYLNNNSGNGDALQFWESSGTVPRFTLTQAGNVGIGTSSPSGQLHVEASAATKILQSNLNSSVTTEVGRNFIYSRGVANNWGAGMVASIPSGAPGVDMVDLGLHTTQGGAFTSSEKGTIKGSGNVGIGTTSPASILTVQTTTPDSAGEKYLRAKNTNSCTGLLLDPGQAGDAGWLLMAGYPNAGDFTIRQFSFANHLTIKKDTGNVGIGTATPGSKLEVAGNINASGTINAVSGLNINGSPVNSSQWSNSGSNINYGPAGNVGIGVVTPGSKL